MKASSIERDFKDVIQYIEGLEERIKSLEDKNSKLLEEIENIKGQAEEQLKENIEI